MIKARNGLSNSDAVFSLGVDRNLISTPSSSQARV